MAYDDVDPAEALDLVATLPPGSLYMASLDPHLAWDDDAQALAAIEDVVWKFLWMKSEHGTTEGAPRVPRPWDEADRRAARARAGDVRRRLESGGWTDVEAGDG